MSSNINHLLKDISIRHACKNVNKYIADIEKSINIKLVPTADGSLEFTYSKDFHWYTDASDARDIILDYFERQKPMMFSIEDRNITGHYRLSFIFKFHPENAV